jgi:tetraacyldisaccharide 4'-kinase
VLTRCDQAESLDALRALVARFAPKTLMVEAVHEPQCLENSEEQRVNVETLRESKIAAFCGIGNPESFRRTLSGLGATIVEMRVFPDHHPYSRQDVENLSQWLDSLPEATLVLTTNKDLVKLAIPQLGRCPLWALRVGLSLRTKQAEFLQLLDRVIPTDDKESPT